MTRKTSDDWRRIGHRNVHTETEKAIGKSVRTSEDAVDSILEIRRTAPSEDDDATKDETDELRDQIRETKKQLILTAQIHLDLAKTIDKLSTDSTLRNLRGEEPLGYSKRDAGATHDAHYGAKAQERQLYREVFWPLNLNSDEWDFKQTAHTRHETDTVTAEGTRKYSKTIGGRTVTVLIDNRGYSPI